MVAKVSIPSRKGKPPVKVRKWCDWCEQIVLVHGSLVNCPLCKEKKSLHTVLPDNTVEF